MGGYHVADSLYLFHCIGRADGKSAKFKNLNIRYIVTNIKDFLRGKAVVFAEGQEILALDARTQENIGLWYSAAGKSGHDGLRPSACNYANRIALHGGHPYSEGILGVEGTVKFAGKVAEHPAIRKNTVHIKGKSPYLFQVLHALRFGTLDGAEVAEVYGVVLTAEEKAEAVVAEVEEKVAEKKATAKKPAEKKAKDAPVKTEKKPAAKATEKKPVAKKAPAAEVIIQSPMGGEITPEAVLAKVGTVEKVYIRVDENKAYWVNGEETGSVDLW